ncbi:hypothetical protein ANANG_G00198420 [Anguilla anguilla]|uniref:Uncharacterized protein n=1 Tax=Anguilla anguilla TaxID=7936 RepID=A0A9D3RSF9_ANGAN|nr:hypothetical protein ANANG_G00198420 [Anguilla anguilla]
MEHRYIDDVVQKTDIVYRHRGPGNRSRDGTEAMRRRRRRTTGDSSCVRSDLHAHRLRQPPCNLRTGPDLGQSANRDRPWKLESRIADGGGETMGVVTGWHCGLAQYAGCVLRGGVSRA